MVSDDTIMYMATYRVLNQKHITIDDFGKALRLEYLKVLPKMMNRDPGTTTLASLQILEGIEWNQLPYNPTSIGSGTSMRTGCVGIFYPGRNNRKRLIALAIEASRITHNSAIGMLGGLVSALFTAYSIERVPVNHWPHKLLKLFKSMKIDNYLQKSRPKEYPFFLRDKVIFIGKWEQYVNFRFSGLTPRLDIRMMQNPVKRIEYLAQNFSRIEKTFFPGGCADDSVIIAYDSLLESGSNLEKLIVYAILHPGDSDTVGCIAMSWFAGAYFTERIYDIVLPRIAELEDVVELLKDIDASIMTKIPKVLVYDMYIHFARRFIRNL